MGFFAFLFVIASLLTIFFADGYRFNFESWQIQKTGGIYISTSVSDASIYVNDRYASATGGLIKYGKLIENLLPKNYGILVYKEGYYPWNKTIAVKEGEVAELKNIFLFPINPRADKIDSDTAKSLIKQFPKAATSTDGFRIRKTKLEYFDEKNKTWLTLDEAVNSMTLDANNEKLLYIKSNEAKINFIKEKNAEVIFTGKEPIKYAVWFSNSAYVLIVSGGDLVIMETNNLGSKRNSVKLLFNISEPFYYDAPNDIFYFRRDKTFYKTRLYTQ